MYVNTNDLCDKISLKHLGNKLFITSNYLTFQKYPQKVMSQCLPLQQSGWTILL